MRKRTGSNSFSIDETGVGVAPDMPDGSQVVLKAVNPPIEPGAAPVPNPLKMGLDTGRF